MTGLGVAVAAGVFAGVNGGVEDGILAGEFLVHGGCAAVGVAAQGRQGAGDEGQGRRADAELGQEAAAGLAGLGVVLFRWVEFGGHVMLPPAAGHWIETRVDCTRRGDNCNIWAGCGMAGLAAPVQYLTGLGVE